MLFPESRKGLESSPLLSRDSGPIGPWKEKSQGTMTNPRAPRFCPRGTPAGTHHSTPPSEMSLSTVLCPTFVGHTRPGTRSPKGRTPWKGTDSPEGDEQPSSTAQRVSTAGGPPAQPVAGPVLGSPAAVPGPSPQRDSQTTPLLPWPPTLMPLQGPPPSGPYPPFLLTQVGPAHPWT